MSNAGGGDQADDRRSSGPDFPRVRQGYHRASVDSFVREVTARIDALQAEKVAQTQEVQRLAAALRESESRYERLSSATVEERAQDLLDVATEQAAATLAEAQRRVEVLEERSRQEHAWRRRQLSRERAELNEQKLAMRAQLRSFRALAVDTTEELPRLLARPPVHPAQPPAEQAGPPVEQAQPPARPAEAPADVAVERHP